MIKRLTTGLIIFDRIDIVLISISLGATVAYLKDRYGKVKTVDPIVAELKRESPLIIPVNVDGTPMKPIKPILVRGGEEFYIHSIVVKSKKLAALVAALLRFNRKYKKMRLVRFHLAVLNAFLTYNFGLRFAAGGSVDYVQVILLVFPSSIVGYAVQQAINNPLITILGPLGLVFGRSIETISEKDPVERCRLLCKYAEEYHNKEILIEMKKFHSTIKEAPVELAVSLECVEDKILLLERFKLRELIKSEKTKKKV